MGDPVRASLEEARRVRDDIERRVRPLLAELHVLPSEDSAQADAEPTPDDADAQV